jgi:DNA-binding transcriptional ArsR family regulator
MSTCALDPLIHDPERLRIVATLAALPHGDALTVTRLQDMIGLPPAARSSACASWATPDTCGRK